MRNHAVEPNVAVFSRAFLCWMLAGNSKQGLLL